LDSLFSTLKEYGSTFPVEFWDSICKETLFPIFSVLKSRQDLSRFHTQEDMSVWLSTTMIQALRDLIDLYTFYFDTLERFLDGLLELLNSCILQGVWKCQRPVSHH
jgi:brefeldin A-inhibited guanine nucleotide-exchange protein